MTKRRRPLFAMIGNVRALLVGLLVLTVAAACTPMPVAGEASAESTATPHNAAALDSDPSAPTTASGPSSLVAAQTFADSESPVLLWRNVAGSAAVLPSAGEETMRLAVDGDTSSMWNSNRFPLGWLLITLEVPHVVNGLELIVAQAPPGPTTHEIWFGNGTGTRTLYRRLVNKHTDDGQTLRVEVEPQRRIREVLINTVQSPSWVAWREVRVFGVPSIDSVQREGSSMVKLNKVVEGLQKPVRISHADDGSGRLFVVEQEGRIRIVRNGLAAEDGEAWSVSEALFLDISERVTCCGEQGLFDIAFPPGYVEKKYFYVSYTDTDGHTIVSRFKLGSDPDSADPTSEEILLTIEQPFDSHNGGRLAFGPIDGYLYIGSGDGGGPSFNDPDYQGQDTSTLLGTILRIDVESGVKPYGIPSSNPFTQIDGVRDEIWAYGLRNPWGFAFDRETGDLYIPDVGAFTREEVNHQPALSAGGENYGWRIMEGSACFEEWACTDGAPCTVEHWLCSAEGLTSPVAEYGRSQGCAIVGGSVYRGAGEPHLQGVFLYADFCSGRIWGLQRPGQDVQDAWQSTLLFNASVPVSSIGEDEKGNVYVLGYQDGTISVVSSRRASQFP